MPPSLMQAVLSAGETPIGNVSWGSLKAALAVFGITGPSEEDMLLTSATIRLTVNSRESQKYVTNIRAVDGSTVIGQVPGIESASTATNSLTPDVKDITLTFGSGVSVVRNTRKSITIQGDITSPDGNALLLPMDKIMVSLVDFTGVGSVSGSALRHALSAPVNGMPLAIRVLSASLDSSSPAGSATLQNNALLARYRFTMAPFEDASFTNITIALSASGGGTLQNVKIVDSTTNQIVSGTATISSGSSQKITLTSSFYISSGSSVTLDVRGDTIGLKQSTPNAAAVTLTDFEAVSTRSNIQLRLLDSPVNAGTLVFF